MRTAAIRGCVITGLFSLLLASGTSFAAEHKGTSGKQAMVERGRYLVSVAGCNDCHSPKRMTPYGPAPDEARLLSGHPADEKLPKVPLDIFGPDKWGANNQQLNGVGRSLGHKLYFQSYA